MAQPKRASLADFHQRASAPPTAGTVQHIEASPAPAPAAKTYPKVNVYLTAHELRTLKLISVDTGERLSDIGAKAIREWLERNGHARPLSSDA